MLILVLKVKLNVCVWKELGYLLALLYKTMYICCCTYVWAVWLWAWCGPTKPVGNKHKMGFWGSSFLIWFWGYFSSTILSPLSFDGSGTPGQSSPPRRGSCGSTPGPTKPCPRLFAAKGGKTVSEHSGWDHPRRWFSDNAQRQYNRTSELQETRVIRLWCKGAVTIKRAHLRRLVSAGCTKVNDTDRNPFIQSRPWPMTGSVPDQTMTSFTPDFKARHHRRHGQCDKPKRDILQLLN